MSFAHIYIERRLPLFGLNSWLVNKDLTSKVNGRVFITAPTLATRALPPSWSIIRPWLDGVIHAVAEPETWEYYLRLKHYGVFARGESNPNASTTRAFLGLRWPGPSLLETVHHRQRSAHQGSDYQNCRFDHSSTTWTLTWAPLLGVPQVLFYTVNPSSPTRFRGRATSTWTWSVPLSTWTSTRTPSEGFAIRSDPPDHHDDNSINIEDQYQYINNYNNFIIIPWIASFLNKNRFDYMSWCIIYLSIYMILTYT